MSPDEIKAKAATLAELFAAKAAGKTLQYLTDSWSDYENDAGPSMLSDLSRWRVKPEPRRMRETPSASSFSNNHNVRTYHQDEADKWKSKGFTVTEWQEVLP